MQYVSQVRSLLATAAIALGPAKALAQPVFQWLGRLPGYEAFEVEVKALSADGSTVVGKNGPRAFRWTAATGMQDIGTNGSGWAEARGVSSDGAVVVGWSGNRAFRWTATGGMVMLPITDGTASMAVAVASDGGQIVGTAWVPSGGVASALRWPTPNSVELLGPLGFAVDMSPDGGVVIGNVPTTCGFRWTATAIQGLCPVYPGVNTVVSDMTPDGAVIVGTTSGVGPTRWDAAGHATLIGPPGASATGISADGRMIVGSLSRGGGSVAALWLDGCELELSCYLRKLGIDAPDCPFGPPPAIAVSAEGHVIVGGGNGPGGTQGWIVVIPGSGGPRRTGDRNGDGSLTTADVAVFVAEWFGSLADGACRGDFDCNGNPQAADVAAFVNAWSTQLNGGC